MKRYCLLAGIPPEKVNPHALKHTCCTLLLSDRHESIVDVQAHVGHADIRNTMIYAKLTSQANQKGLEGCGTGAKLIESKKARLQRVRRGGLQRARIELRRC